MNTKAETAKEDTEINDKKVEDIKDDLKKRNEQCWREIDASFIYIYIYVGRFRYE